MNPTYTILCKHEDFDWPEVVGVFTDPEEALAAMSYFARWFADQKEFSFATTKIFDVQTACNEIYDYYAEYAEDQEAE